MNIRIRLITILLILIIQNCKKIVDSEENNYIKLEVVELFSKPIDSISVKIAETLNVGPLTFDKIISTQYRPEKYLLKQGYQYLTGDSATIIIWTDSSDQAFEINYFHEVGVGYNSFTYEKSVVDSFLFSTLMKAGIEQYIISDLASHTTNLTSYIQIRMGQKYQDTMLPQIKAEITGDTIKFNYLFLFRLYENLNKIEQLVSNEKLKSIVFVNLKKQGEELSIEELIGSGYDVIQDKLCKRFRYIKWGSGIPPLEIHTYIDIQNGKVIYKHLHRDPR